MSNPGVKTLTEKRISGRKPFRVEDNLGESVHIHYNDIRIDLTVRELLQLAEVCDESLYDLIRVDGFNLDDYDGDFLVKYAREIYDLKQIKREKAKVAELYYLSKNRLKIPVRKHVRNFSGTTLNSNKLPVVFNDENTLVYGASQVKKIYDTDPNREVDIIRLYFKYGKHAISKHPWIPYLFKWNKSRMKEAAFKIARKMF